MRVTGVDRGEVPCRAEDGGGAFALADEAERCGRGHGYSPARSRAASARSRSTGVCFSSTSSGSGVCKVSAIR